MELLRGDNHLITTRGRVLVCEVWSRPEMSPEDGARNAQRLVTFLTETALAAGAPYDGLLLDVRRVQPAFGPATRAALSDLFARVKERGQRIAVLVGDSAIQHLQFRRLRAELDANVVGIFGVETAASDWLKPPPGARPRSR